ncbi:MAG: J domain-containing protein, partial [Actinobacteria bacterium]|nr:J domain-containing protein [Actinomycetota bacterium]
MSDYYEVLGVARNASHETIHRAYRVLARRLHPDVAHVHGARTEDMAAVNEAWHVLADEHARNEYDRSLGIERTNLDSLLVYPQPPAGFFPIGGWTAKSRAVVAGRTSWARHDPGRPGKWQMTLTALSDDLSGLDDCKITDVGLAHLATIETLEELLLFGTEVT